MRITSFYFPKKQWIFFFRIAQSMPAYKTKDVWNKHYFTYYVRSFRSWGRVCYSILMKFSESGDLYSHREEKKSRLAVRLRVISLSAANLFLTRVCSQLQIRFSMRSFFLSPSLSILRWKKKTIISFAINFQLAGAQLECTVIVCVQKKCVVAVLWIEIEWQSCFSTLHTNVTVSTFDITLHQIFFFSSNEIGLFVCWLSGAALCSFILAKFVIIIGATIVNALNGVCRQTCAHSMQMHTWSQSNLKK